MTQHARRLAAVLFAGAALAATTVARLAAQSPPVAVNAGGPATPVATSELRETVTRFALDRAALQRRHPLAPSPDRLARLPRFYREWQSALEAVDYATLSAEARLDHLLLRNRMTYDLRLLSRERQWFEDTAALLPFAPLVTSLHDARMRLETIDPEQAARALDRLAGEVDAARKRVEAGPSADATSAPHRQQATPPTAPDDRRQRLVAFRAQEALEPLQDALKTWYEFYAGYHPLFTWWASAPYERAAKALGAYRTTLRERIVGIKAGEDEPIVGTPIGRDALVADLASEFVPYSPEDLLALGERELKWCEEEMKKAAREMGMGDDWRAALEKVKTLHVAPGAQIDLVRDLAREAEAYVEEHGLLTVPPLAKEVWRMQMMSPERQKVSPFFLGGETIIVSFPTDTMAHDDKMMSLRGNNAHFSRATVFHELIPGHHLQGFMTARYNPHRAAFGTPFWTEGWALYWEMLLWDRGFVATPDNKVGALFWRMHRAARIVFSLNFHLGRWTPQQCIDLLVNQVGHERANAEAEVRRSFNGTYPPLYQLAYMVGGLQFRALHRELVGNGTMTDRAFHDAILTGGPMPVEFVRARLTNQALARDHQASWRFADR